MAVASTDSAGRSGVNESRVATQNAERILLRDREQICTIFDKKIRTSAHLKFKSQEIVNVPVDCAMAAVILIRVLFYIVNMSRSAWNGGSRKKPKPSCVLKQTQQRKMFGIIFTLFYNFTFYTISAETRISLEVKYTWTTSSSSSLLRFGEKL